ncbi:hypothetical protein [Bacilliculturomica massiliensis]|uniref:hypothetical protein n=1 Tax=Bacilliculturomica massiliensis TaxID=1917867 RepID=UPI0010325AF2|nr:hypothetical protein [Bacilliculturomica massiliensis]
MNINSITGDLIEVSLRQLGASEIKMIKSDMFIVNFEVGDGMIVSYVFNITSGDKYFLQRMRPYAISHGKFADEREIVSFITKDLKKFQNAAQSSNFRLFVKEAEQINRMNECIEQLFLNHNVDSADLEKLGREIDGVIDLIGRIKEDSKTI